MPVVITEPQAFMAVPHSVAVGYWNSFCFSRSSFIQAGMAEAGLLTGFLILKTHFIKWGI
jgi:hypothetical protein